MEDIKLILNSDYDLWYKMTENIILDEEFQKRKKFKHHEKQSVYDHLILVSAYSYILAKKYHADIYNSTIAGLLHDFYTKAWQYSPELEELDIKYRSKFIEETHTSLLQKHGFIHPYDAANNAKEYYGDYINERILSAIKTHMFPLSLLTESKIPHYKESWIITLSDKIVTFKDLPTPKELPKYLGINIKSKKTLVKGKKM